MRNEVKTFENEKLNLQVRTITNEEWFIKCGDLYDRTALYII